MTINTCTYQSPIGLIEIAGNSDSITALQFTEQPRAGNAESSILQLAKQQLAEYFDKKRHEFDLNLQLDGTPFQKTVWAYLLTVPFGKIISYQDVANGIGNPKAVRAVGAANGKNPISIIVPCHRIVGGNRHLIGYGGGLWRKEWLLKHEGSLLL